MNTIGSQHQVQGSDARQIREPDIPRSARGSNKTHNMHGAWRIQDGRWARAEAGRYDLEKQNTKDDRPRNEVDKRSESIGKQKRKREYKERPMQRRRTGEAKEDEEKA